MADSPFKGLLYSPEVLGGIGLLTAGLSGQNPGVALPQLMQGMKTASMFRAMDEEEEKRKFIKEFGSSIPEEDQAFFKAYPKVYLQNKYKKKDKPQVVEIFKGEKSKSFNINNDTELMEMLKLTNNEEWSLTKPTKRTSTNLYEIYKDGESKFFDISTDEGLNEVIRLGDQGWSSKQDGKSEFKNFYDTNNPTDIRTFNLSDPDDRKALKEFRKDPKTNVIIQPTMDKSTDFLQKKSITDAQGKIINAIKLDEQLENIEMLHDPRFSTYLGMADARFSELMEKAGFKTSQEREAFMAKRAEWESAVQQYFADYRKAITGVAAGEKEIKLLEASVANVNDSPTVFIRKIKLSRALMKQVVERNRRFVELDGQEPTYDANGKPSGKYKKFLEDPKNQIQINEEIVVPFIQDLQYYKYSKKQIEFKLKQFFGKESLPKINAILENLK